MLDRQRGDHFEEARKTVLNAYMDFKIGIASIPFDKTPPVITNQLIAALDLIKTLERMRDSPQVEQGAWKDVACRCEVVMNNKYDDD
ncbi:hypothetical protein ACHAQA_000742 [Verticillium albo-atrum]